METELVTITPIADVEWRRMVRVRGRVRSMRIEPWQGIATLELTLYDETGGLIVVFNGRRQIGGVTLGAWMEVEGRSNSHHGRLALINPRYELVPAA